jgi:hypothetical protein
MNLLNRRDSSAAIAHTVSPDEAAQAAAPGIAAFTQSAAGASPAATPVAPAPLPRGVTVVTAQGSARRVRKADVAQLERLRADDALVQFRSFRSFGYSASLVFDGATPDYYVSLYHDEILWRAFVTDDLDLAETTFRQMEEQITRMTEGEIARAQLKAEHERVTNLIRQSEAQAEKLQHDIERDALHTQLVSAKQHELRKELAQLEAQRVSMQAQLSRTLRRLQSLRLTSNETVPHPPPRRDDHFRK